MECPNCHENIYHSHLAEYKAIFTETDHLRELRTTNNPASAGELGYVRNELLPAIENGRRTLEKRISQLRMVVELLEKERRNLNGLVDEIKSLISPLRRLPPEILTEIFEYASARDCDYDSSDWIPNFHRSDTPCVLTHVCSGWRKIALSCPAIWSRISHPGVRHSQSYSEAVDAVLSRSGRFPLCIEIAPSERGHESAAQAFLERVSAHASRWRALTLYIDSQFASTAFNLLCRPYPLVDRLDVDIDKQGVFPIPQTGLSQYPGLRTFVLRDRRMITTDLPWAQITTLLISPSFVRWEGYWASYSQVLGQCPSLQTLVIASESIPRIEIPDQASTLTLKDLKCLETSFALVMDHLCLPRLEVARLSTGRDQRRDDPQELQRTVASFQKLIRRSMCSSSLHSLHMKKIPITKELLSLLSLTQNLVTLNIRAHMVHSTTFPPVHDPEAVGTITSLVEMLEVKHGAEPSFLPRLQHLSISVSRHLDTFFPYLGYPEDLVDTLQSRWNVGNRPGVERLQTFEYWISARHVYVNDRVFAYPSFTWSSETEAALRLLEDEGMRISIRVRSKLVESDKYLLDFGRHYA